MAISQISGTFNYQLVPRYPCTGICKPLNGRLETHKADTCKLSDSCLTTRGGVGTKFNPADLSLSRTPFYSPSKKFFSKLFFLTVRKFLN